MPIDFTFRHLRRLSNHCLTDASRHCRQISPADNDTTLIADISVSGCCCFHDFAATLTLMIISCLMRML